MLMAPQADPPVCRIMDYGRYRFEREKKEKEARRRQQTVELKEIQISYRIDTHDFETKVRHALRFLSEGNKVRVVMRFRGREMAHIPLGHEILARFEVDVLARVLPRKTDARRKVSQHDNKPAENQQGNNIASRG